MPRSEGFPPLLLLLPALTSHVPWSIDVLSMAGHSVVISPQYFDQLWVSVLTTAHCRKMLHRPKLIATLIHVHKCSYLDGNLTGTVCPFSKTKAMTFPIGHMPCQDVGLCLGLQYQTWTPSYGPSIIQIFLSYCLWSGIPSELHASQGSVSDIRGSSVKCMRFLGAWHTAWYIHSHGHSWSPFIQSQGSCPPCCSLPPQQACI